MCLVTLSLILDPNIWPNVFHEAFAGPRLLFTFQKFRRRFLFSLPIILLFLICFLFFHHINLISFLIKFYAFLTSVIRFPLFLNFSCLFFLLNNNALKLLLSLFLLKPRLMDLEFLLLLLNLKYQPFRDSLEKFCKKNKVLQYHEDLFSLKDLMSHLLKLLHLLTKMIKFTAQSVIK